MESGGTHGTDRTANGYYYAHTGVRHKGVYVMDIMLHLLETYEPLWLLVVLIAELVYSIRIHTMAKIEYEYDREWNERKAARRKKHIQFDELNQGEGK